MEVIKHADTLSEVECLILNALVVCEGLGCASNQMEGRQYNETAAGAFGLLALALRKARDLVEETEYDLRHT